MRSPSSTQLAEAAPPVAAVTELVLKLHERCNLACDHCYMYESADQAWRDRPVVMAAETISRLADRLADHVRSHGLADVRVVLHGGEPLLVGMAAFESAITTIRAKVPAAVSFAVQTNGVLLDERFLNLLQRHQVRVGISIDGGRDANDRHRRYANGHSSYDGVVTAIRLLAQPRFSDIYGGLLCTVDVRNDPVGAYESLLEFGPPRIDFLLPHGNWLYPPPGLDREGTTTPYGDWLVAIFDRWYGAPRREVEVRLFDSLLVLVLGGTVSESEVLGLNPSGCVVVETDGSFEGNDALKTAGPGRAGTSLTVFAHSLDDVLSHPSVGGARMGLAGLGPACQQCPVVAICGGGLHAHRFDPEVGFQAPSVYCRDLYRLIRHAQGTVRRDLVARLGVGGDV